MKSKKIYIFIGTTAELIKLAPVLKEFKRRGTKFTVIASGQNNIVFDELQSFTGKLNIIYAVRPKANQSSVVKFLVWSLRSLVSLMVGMRGLFDGLNKTNSYFIVHGDTVSSLIGAVVARLYGLNLVHIESGLRSFNFFEPFPEEICRYIISRLADIHFCPNQWSLNNLKQVDKIKINTQQNTLYDIYRTVIKKPSKHPFVNTLQKNKNKYFVLVIHRQEHVIFNKSSTQAIIQQIFKIVPSDLQCIFMVHDLSANFISSLQTTIPKKIIKNIIKSPRLPYQDFMHVLSGAEFMITDGGSNQEELYYMGKPCLLIRNCTERIEGLNKNVVVSQENELVIRQFIEEYQSYQQPPISDTVHPSQIIVDALIKA